MGDEAKMEDSRDCKGGLWSAGDDGKREAFVGAAMMARGRLRSDSDDGRRGFGRAAVQEASIGR